jgi:hypothetical protein
MPLANYGLLTGRVVEHGPAASGNPHYLVAVQAGGIRYQVSLEHRDDAAGPGSFARDTAISNHRRYAFVQAEKSSGACWLAR